MQTGIIKNISQHNQNYFLYWEEIMNKLFCRFSFDRRLDHIGLHVTAKLLLEGTIP